MSLAPLSTSLTCTPTHPRLRSERSPPPARRRSPSPYGRVGSRSPRRRSPPRRDSRSPDAGYRRRPSPPRSRSRSPVRSPAAMDDDAGYERRASTPPRSRSPA